jgi:2'-5' RNA ligase
VGPPRDVVRWVRVLATFTSDWFDVEEFVLIESHLGEGPRGRPRYEERARFSIGGTRETVA